MTKISQKKIDQFIIKWEQLLQIKEWDIHSDIKKLKKKNATILWHHKTRFALLSVDPNIENLEKGVIHELLHLLFADWYDSIDLFVKTFVKDEDAKKYLKERVDLEEHRVIERIDLLLYFLGGKDRAKNTIKKLEENNNGDNRKSFSLQRKRTIQKMDNRLSHKGN